MKLDDRLSRYLGKEPKVGARVFIAPNVTLVGDVQIGDFSSVWYGSVLRGDINQISVGLGTNLQDGVVGHVSDDQGLTIGDYVTVGHGAILHACTIGNECLIGMRSVIMDGAMIGSHSIIAAGAIVPSGMMIPEASLVVGLPAIVKRGLSEKETQKLKGWADKYIEVAKAHQNLSENM